MCYIHYQICNSQIKARVKYKVLSIDMLKKTENDKKKKHTTKVFKNVFVLLQKNTYFNPLKDSMLVKKIGYSRKF